MLRTSRRLVAAAVQASPAALGNDGYTVTTNETAIGSCTYLLAKEIEITPLTGDSIERDYIRGYTGSYTSYMANKQAQMTLTVELTSLNKDNASASTVTEADVPGWDPLMQACGNTRQIADVLAVGDADTNADAITYTPMSLGGSVPICTIRFFLDGLEHVMHDCRGTFTLNYQAGEVPTIVFTMTGIYKTPDTVTFPDTTALGNITYKQMPGTVFQAQYSDTAANSHVPAGGFAFAGIESSGSTNATFGCSSFTFEQGNEIIYRSVVGTAPEVKILERRTTGTAVVQGSAANFKSLFEKAENELLASTKSQVLHGREYNDESSTNLYRRVLLTVDQTRVGQPTYQDDSGIHLLSCPFAAVPSNTGNDEYKLTLF